MIQGTIISILLVVLSILLINPLHFWMPDTLTMSLTAGVVVVFTLFAVFVWKERSRDEREQLHLMLAGRIAFLVGTGVLVVGIAFQSLSHTIDPWLVTALVLMVLAKVIGLLYGQWKK